MQLLKNINKCYRIMIPNNKTYGQYERKVDIRNS